MPEPSSSFLGPLSSQVVIAIGISGGALLVLLLLAFVHRHRVKRLCSCSTGGWRRTKASKADNVGAGSEAAVRPSSADAAQGMQKRRQQQRQMYEQV